MKQEYLVIAVIAVTIACLLLALSECSSDSVRRVIDSNPPHEDRDTERHKIIEQGRDFCVKYPDDVACPGKR